MRVLIVGAEGTQGRRYRAILKFLSISYFCSDLSYPTSQIPKDFDAILIATPTDSHASVIREHLKYQCPILCEKPISKNVEEVKALFEEAKKAKVALSMIMQYRQLLPLNLKSRSKSHYDYFKHGNDGLVWDCLQIIALARGEVSLSEVSPVWKCKINGYTLYLSEMDKAYIREVKDWLSNSRYQAPEEIIQIHQKVEAFARKEHG